MAAEAGAGSWQRRRAWLVSRGPGPGSGWVGGPGDRPGDVLWEGPRVAPGWAQAHSAAGRALHFRKASRALQTHLWVRPGDWGRSELLSPARWALKPREGASF